ncbi:bacteriohopanetetrol glucosamine biosynthesis glycosyltransferase HpnI [Novosphingobium sp.]|uniref:bacteriohopanetetrol glucosamine biosynthesis glycosyltransferase HpnI n=1 Tax=Novosphingobium sp. TaxID=1874826 RepID=UPI0025F5D71C|nr:bacteriohopanetetrol glucosamine biosynthesis glycosyltransferase HpnI [Novosphingobium sp.]
MALAHNILAGVGWALVVLSVAGSVYTLAAAGVLVRFLGRRNTRPARSDAVTLLKPLYGAEPRLLDNLASFCTLDHAGPLQIVVGVQRADDPALDAVAHLRGRFPKVRIDLVTGADVAGANRKVANLIAMAPHAVHPVLVLSDSDMAAPQDYLVQILPALDTPGVGAVTCAYHGRGDAGLWSRMGAAGLDWQMLPGVVFGTRTGLATPCMGSTIALHAETLAAIGGFEVFAGTLADDYAIGAAIRARGETVVVPPLLVTHGSADRSLAELWRHEVRWAATVLGVEPIGHVASVIAMPLPLAMLALPLVPSAGQVALILAWVARAVLVQASAGVSGEKPFGSTILAIALLPIRDILGFAVYIASFGARSVVWRGEKLTMKPEGRIETGAEISA